LGLLNRFPSLQDNLKVYAVIAVLVYAWSILWLFWELPSWLYYLTVAEIIPVFAYALATNLFESLLILAALNLLCFILPQTWFHESFVARSFFVVALGLGYLMFFASSFGKEGDYPRVLLSLAPGAFVMFFILGFLVTRIVSLKKITEQIADRLVIFLYLTIPLSMVALLVIVVRNIW